ncbi:MAG: cyclic nucleotide-binding domain-containing protein [Magnetococcus sp. YQC-5]
MNFNKIMSFFNKGHALFSSHSLFRKQEKLLGKIYPEGELIIREGEDSSHHMYYIETGSVEVFKKRFDQRETRLAILDKGEIFGEMGVFDGAPHWASVRVLGTKTRILTLDSRTLMRRVHDDPFLILTILQKMANRLRRMNKLYTQLSREQIAAYSALSGLVRYFRHPEIRPCMEEKVIKIAMKLREWGKYTEELDDSFIDNLKVAFLLYDVGAEGVDRDILEKKGHLTSEEWNAIRQHASIGAHVLVQAASQSDHSPCLNLAAEVAEFHHEHYNGKGYHGVQGEAIPISARIIAVVDTFDSLMTDRPYRQGYSQEKAIAIIKEEARVHFDPDVVAAFLAIL